MSYFTRSRYERMMMQKPRPQREDAPPPAPVGHPCYGCKRYGMACVRPCYRDVKRMVVKPCAS